MKALVDVHDVSKAFDVAGGTIEAVRGATLQAAAGEFVALVGPSGCGKSTLLAMMAGLVSPASGTIHVDGEPLTRPHRHIGVVFQGPVLLPWRTVEQNVLLPAEIFGGDMAAHRRRAEAAIDAVGLADFRRAYPRQLSGGMQQRAALARVLAYDPRVLLMDEPFGALDELSREAMNLELMRVTQSAGITVILVTHDIAEAVFLADRVIVMTARPGRITGNVQVTLPRPRTIRTMHDRRFADLTFEVRGLLGAAA